MFAILLLFLHYISDCCQQLQVDRQMAAVNYDIYLFNVFNIRALKECLNLCNTTNKCTVHNMFYHILLITNRFRSLLRSSLGQLYRSVENTAYCQIIQAKQLSFIINTSYSPYDHKMSGYVLLKSHKIQLLNNIGCIVVCS